MSVACNLTRCGIFGSYLKLLPKFQCETSILFRTQTAQLFVEVGSGFRGYNEDMICELSMGSAKKNGTFSKVEGDEFRKGRRSRQTIECPLNSGFLLEKPR